MRILICEELNAALPAAREDEHLDYMPNLWSRRSDLLIEAASASALVVRNRTQVDEELLQAASTVRAIGRLGSGLDNIDTMALQRHGISLVDGGGLNSRAVAEYVMGAMLAVARHLPRSDRELRAGLWRGRVGLEMKGQTLGVIGLGATGSEVCRLGLALGMRVLGYDALALAPATPGVERVTMEDLLPRSLVVTVHVPLSDETRALIGDHEIQLMPPGAILINAARGGLIDEEALTAGLLSGHIGAAALDVRTVEPPPLPDPLAQFDQVLLTPHIAGWTASSQKAIAEHVLGGIRRALGA
jgi:phosphoglycerate dehydrogenase-like enzyme